MRLLSRDRRPRLSATTFHLTLQATSLMRTDEGVCPYFKALSGQQNSSLISSHEALLPLGEVGRGSRRGRLSLLAALHPIGLITRLLVYSYTRQLELIIILNYEL